MTVVDYIVYDSIMHLPQDIGTSRIIMTGAKYKFFLPQNKIPPFDSARVKLFLQNNAQPLSKALTENLLGVSQATVNEVLFGSAYATAKAVQKANSATRTETTVRTDTKRTATLYFHHACGQPPLLFSGDDVNALEAMMPEKRR